MACGLSTTGDKIGDGRRPDFLAIVSEGGRFLESALFELERICRSGSVTDFKLNASAVSS